MRTDKPEIAKIFTDCRNKSVETTNHCFYPGCKNKSINSHILQKNGILSSISKDRHLWEYKVDHFKKPYIEFKNTGLNKIYTYLGFCSKHDDSLFKKIENNELDFNDYETNLLFALRTLYNELWLKQVVIKMQNCIIDSDILIDRELLNLSNEQNKLGIKDLTFFEKDLWKDLNEKSETFTIKYRELDKQELCLNAIYTYDTSKEILDYKNKHNNDMERLSEIFISFFPYKNKSILLMSYHNNDENKVKSFVNQFFSENQKRVYRKITNLIIFHCETWVCSDNFYQKKIKGIENIFFKATNFSSKHFNERTIFDLNIFDLSFKTKFEAWNKKYNG